MAEKTVKKRKIRYIFGISFIMLCAVVIFLLLAKYIEKRQYRIELDIAGGYLSGGNYKEALASYQKILAEKGDSYEDIIIGLSSSYVGLKDYENALLVLREAYEKVGSNVFKEQIELVSGIQLNSEYEDKVKRGQTYESNLEYEKAITEYDKARQLKVKEAMPYERIAECYIAVTKYQEARAEVEKGLSVAAETKVLEDILHNIDYLENIDTYQTLLEETKELVYQENYAAAMTNYLKAIDLLPYEEDAYLGLVDVYMILQQYDGAQKVIDKANKLMKSVRLEEIEIEIQRLAAKQKEREDMLKELYQAMKNKNINQAISIMKTDAFIQEFRQSYPLFYTESGEGAFGDGFGMILYGSGNVYLGNVIANLRNGNGFNLKHWEEDHKERYYSYDGEWSNDNPNGYGIVKEAGTIEGNFIFGEIYLIKMTGVFTNGYEDNDISKEIYDQEENFLGTVQYRSKMGVAQPLLDEDGYIQWVYENRNYVYGRVFKDGKDTGYYLSTTATTIMQGNYN